MSIAGAAEEMSRTCPACGTENDLDVVFCGACNRALGEFRYIAEEAAAERRWYEAVADGVAAFVGRPHFLVAHAVWFVAWIVLNTSITAAAMLVHRFDDYPFNLLSILLAMEAVFLTGFLLISQNRQNAYAEKRAELDYVTSVLTYRRLEEIERLLHAVVQERPGAKEGDENAIG